MSVRSQRRLEEAARGTAPRGTALADAPRALSSGQLTRLGEALDALHGVGGAHGRVDAEHLYLHDGEVALAFPRDPGPGDIVSADREALSRLGA